MFRFYQLLISIDQSFNCVFGSGFADETLSAFSYRKQDWRMKVIDTILWFDKDHCYNSYLSEIYKRQYPQHYQKYVTQEPPKGGFFY